MALLVDVVSKKGFGDLANKIEEALLKALHFLGENNCSVEVCILEDKEMALVNKKSRGKEGSTTVLSFEEPEEIPETRRTYPARCFADRPSRLRQNSAGKSDRWRSGCAFLQYIRQ